MYVFGKWGEMRVRLRDSMAQQGLQEEVKLPAGSFTSIHTSPQENLDVKLIVS